MKSKISRNNKKPKTPAKEGERIKLFKIKENSPFFKVRFAFSEITVLPFVLSLILAAIKRNKYSKAVMNLTMEQI